MSTRSPAVIVKHSTFGETRRSLQKRIAEHKYNPMTGRIALNAVHAWDREYRPDWDATKIVEMESQYLKRAVMEAIWIQKTPLTCNLDCGLTDPERDVIDLGHTFSRTTLSNFSFFFCI